MLTLIMLLTLALVLAFISTPTVSAIASRNGFVDRPGARKVHREDIPLLGGLSIYLAFAFIIFHIFPMSMEILSLLLGSTLILCVGVLDDIIKIKPVVKLSGQAAAASIIVLLNVGSYDFLIDYFSKRLMIPEALTLALIIGWIMLIINAFNLIDGLDGLAAGTAIVILAGLATVTLIKDNTIMLGLLVVIIGACLGFLPYNFQPAKIFMGDTGSMLLGFLLASMHLFVIAEPFSSALVLGSAFIFAYPALDITYALYRRLHNGNSILKADQDHIHHILIRLGLTVRQAVLTLYVISILFTGIAVVVLTLDFEPYFILGLGIATILCVTWLFFRLNRLSKVKEASLHMKGMFSFNRIPVQSAGESLTNKKAKKHG